MIRKVVSISLCFSFILILVSSAILYIAPEGRVAYWGNWQALMLTKTQWTNLHLTGGVMFALLSLWHIVFNWKVLIAHIVHTTKELGRMPVALLVALAVNWLVYAGTITNIQPMKQIIVWKEDIKSYQAKVNGTPPFPHAELSSVEKFCNLLDWDVEKTLQGLATLKLAGTLTSDSVILDIANENNMTPQQLYSALQPLVANDVFLLLPPSPPEGTGKKTIGMLSEEYNLPAEIILARLQKVGIAASLGQTIRDVATKNNITPQEVYQAIRVSK